MQCRDACLSVSTSLQLYVSVEDRSHKIVGFHDATRLATLHNSYLISTVRVIYLLSYRIILSDLIISYLISYLVRVR